MVGILVVLYESRMMLETVGRMTRSVKRALLSEGKEDPLKEPTSRQRVEKQVIAEKDENGTVEVERESTGKMNKLQQTAEDDMPIGWFLETLNDQRMEPSRQEQISTKWDLEEVRQRMDRIRRDLDGHFGAIEQSMPANTENEVYPLGMQPVDATKFVPTIRVPAIKVTREPIWLSKEGSRATPTNTTIVTTRVMDSKIYNLQRALERLDPITRRAMFEQLAKAGNGLFVYHRSSTSVPVSMKVSIVETSTSAPTSTEPSMLLEGRTIGWKPQPSLVGGGRRDVAGQFLGGGTRLPHPSDLLRSGGVTNPIRSKSLSDGDRMNATEQLPSRVNATVQLLGGGGRLPYLSEPVRSGSFFSRVSAPLQSKGMSGGVRHFSDDENRRKEQESGQIPSEYVPSELVTIRLPYNTKPSRNNCLTLFMIKVRILTPMFRYLNLQFTQMEKLMKNIR